MSGRVNAGPVGCSTGCLWPALLLCLVLAAALWVVSSVGHLVGLTPTFDELSQHQISPSDAWMKAHYPHIGWGLLAAALLTAMVPLALAAANWKRINLALDETGSSDVSFTRSAAPVASGQVVLEIGRPPRSTSARKEYDRVVHEVWVELWGVSDRDYFSGPYPNTSSEPAIASNGGIRAALEKVARTGSPSALSNNIDPRLLEKARTVLSDQRVLAVSEKAHR